MRRNTVSNDAVVKLNSLDSHKRLIRFGTTSDVKTYLPELMRPAAEPTTIDPTNKTQFLLLAISLSFFIITCAIKK